MTNPIENALNEMHNQWIACTKDLTTLEQESNQLLQDQHKLLLDSETFHYNYEAAKFHMSEEQYALKYPDAQIRSDIAAINEDNTNIGSEESAIMAANGGCTLIQVLNSVIGKGTFESVFSNESKVASKYLSSIFRAMKENLHANEQFQLLQNKQVQNSTSTEEQIAEQMLHDETMEQSDLGNFMSTLLSNLMMYNQQYDNAKVNYSSYNAIQIFFSLSDDAHRENDERIMANALKMEKTIRTIMKALAPAIAQVSSTAYTQIQLLLQNLMKELQDVLGDSKLSSQEKEGKLLGLVLFALGLFGVIQQTQENAKTEFEKEMTEANMDATKMNMANQQANAKIIQEEVHNAKVMKVVQIVATIVMGTIAALMGGVGTAVLMAALTVLEATGEMNKATQALATAIGNALHNHDTGEILADVTVTVAEIVVAGGGGLALDGLLASRFATGAAVNAATEAAINTARATMQDTTRQALTQVAEQVQIPLDEAAINAAERTVTRTTEEAAKLAAQKTAEQFYKQPMMQILTLIAKGSFSQTLKEVTETAATNAAIAAASSAKTISVAADTAEASLEASNPAIAGLAPAAVARSAAIRSASFRTAQINEIARQAAGKSIAEKFGTKSEDEINHLNLSARSQAFRRTAGRAVLSGVFGIGSTNMISNIVKAYAAAHHETVNNAGMITMEVIQAVMQAIAMMGAMSSSITLTEAPTALMRVSMATQGSAQATSGATHIQMANMMEVQADAETGLQMTNAVADLLHATLEQMQQDIKNSQQAYFTQEKTESQIMNQLAIHLYDGENAGNQVLTNLAG